MNPAASEHTNTLRGLVLIAPGGTLEETTACIDPDAWTTALQKLAV